MNKKLSLRQVNLNKERTRLMQKQGFSLLRNPNPKLRGIPAKEVKVFNASQNVSEKENQ